MFRNAGSEAPKLRINVAKYKNESRMHTDD